MFNVCAECASKCASACSGFCTDQCTNKCTSRCFGNCSNVCVGSCSGGCSVGCEADCVKDCAGSTSSLNIITTRYDYASSRKTTSILDSNGTGYFIYPGLYGNVIIYRVVENNISAKVGSVSSSIRDSSGFTPDEMRKVIMESLMKFTDLDDFDIKHLMMDRLELQRLFEDIRDWTWNTRKY